MENEKRDSSADGCSQATKIKTHFAKIIVGGTAEKPCYDILYFDPTDREYHIGFGSFCLEYVFKWLSEEFEIVDAPTVDAVEVVLCRDCARCFKLTTKRNKQKMLICMKNEMNVCVRPDDFCSYGERRTDG